MKKEKRLFKRFFSVVFVLWLVAGIGFASSVLQGCKDEGNCLEDGEDCTQQYKIDEYGNTEIQCCTGTCAEHGSGYLTCGS